MVVLVSAGWVRPPDLSCYPPFRGRYPPFRGRTRASARQCPGCRPWCGPWPDGRCPKPVRAAAPSRTATRNRLTRSARRYSQPGRSPRDISRDRWSPATRTCRGTLTGADEKVMLRAPAPRRSGRSGAMPGTGPESSRSSGWERSGNHGCSYVRPAALVCSLVRGLQLRKQGSALVAGMWMHSWGSRGRRFKSGRPDW
jgi:hypothetical protein